MITVTHKIRSLAVLLGAAAITGCAIGQGRDGQPEWENQPAHAGQHDYRRSDQDDRHRGQGGRQRHFEQRHQVVVRDYYAREFHSRRHCPPGFAIRHNGCTPPSYARHWRVGHPLHRDVVYYDVPHSLVLQIGAPPRGHRYVRVAGDLLLIAIGTALVVDAIEDLSWR